MDMQGMNNRERRDKGLAYISDADVIREMAECQKKLKLSLIHI